MHGLAYSAQRMHQLEAAERAATRRRSGFAVLVAVLAVANLVRVAVGALS